MLTGAQVRAARALLDWSQDELAQAAGLGVATVRRLENDNGPIQGHTSTVTSLERVFIGAGIVFVGDEGRLGVWMKLQP